MLFAPRFAFAALLALAGTSPLSHSSEPPVSAIEREALLSLPWKLFDQTPESGWRKYVNAKRSEYMFAAQLIEEYLARHKDLTPRERALCHFHGAMMYVYRAVRTNGDPSVAIPRIRGAIAEENSGLPADWNHMVRATVAFLENDRDTLLVLKEEVDALPKEKVKWPDYPKELLQNLGKPYGSWAADFDRKPQ